MSSLGRSLGASCEAIECLNVAEQKSNGLEGQTEREG